MVTLNDRSFLKKIIPQVEITETVMNLALLIHE